MVGNCDKMVLISSTSNEWQQNNQVIDDVKTGCFNNNNNNMSCARVIMDEKLPAGISHEQQQQIHKQQNQEPLRCPRCDSTNTKFCYYNNYSLSQPRHFCKACKRYWTRGGTLRNVPVGGGCRKNKRVRRPSSSSSSTTSACSSSSSLTNPSFNNNNSDHHLHHLHGTNDFISNSPSNHHPSLFYGLPSIHNHNLASDVNFPFTRYDLQNQPHNMNGIGLGFQSSSCGFGGEGLGGGGGFHIPTSKQIFQDLISSNPLLSHYATTTTTTTSTSSTPTISSLLANSLHLKAPNNFQTMLPSYDHQDSNQLLKGNGDVNSSGGMFMKEVKMELEAQNRSSLQQHHWSNSNQNQMDQTFVGSSSDPSLIWSSGGGNNNGNNLGAWLDPSTNIGSSVPSLI